MPTASGAVMGMAGSPGAAAKAAEARRTVSDFAAHQLRRVGSVSCPWHVSRYGAGRRGAGSHLSQDPDLPGVPSLESVVVADPEAVSFRKEPIPWADPH